MSKAFALASVCFVEVEKAVGGFKTVELIGRDDVEVVLKGDLV